MISDFSAGEISAGAFFRGASNSAQSILGGKYAGGLGREVAHEVRVRTRASGRNLDNTVTVANLYLGGAGVGYGGGRIYGRAGFGGQGGGRFVTLTRLIQRNNLRARRISVSLGSVVIARQLKVLDMKDRGSDCSRDRQHGDSDAAVFPGGRAQVGEDHLVTAWSPTLAAM